jgi:plasmid maintenance system antidote protein VapI
MEIHHPGKLLQQELTSKGLTQKIFATMIGKKISEVNELIKWKRNITVQRDILLSIVFDDPEQKRIKIQNNFDYVRAKSTMTKKIQEIVSKKKKTKWHQVFKDF